MDPTDSLPAMSPVDKVHCDNCPVEVAVGDRSGSVGSEFHSSMRLDPGSSSRPDIPSPAVERESGTVPRGAGRRVPRPMR